MAGVRAGCCPKASRKRAKVSYADKGVSRVWSEEDEVALLHGMIDYAKDPRSDYQAFHHFVKDSIHANVSVDQLSAKIRKLKNNFLLHVDKGDALVFAKPHAHILFHLSKNIWPPLVIQDTDNNKKKNEASSTQQPQNDVVQESESQSASPKPSEGRASVKRKLTVDPKPTGKRAKLSNTDTTVTRLWSEEDELALLHAMIDYEKDPRSDYQAFHHFVKDSIKTNVSIKQLRDKISRLKIKYFVNADKGDDVVFAKPHDDNLFHLSTKIWGVDNKEEDEVEDRDEGVVGENKNQTLEFKEMYPYLSEVWESDVDFPKPLKDIGVEKLIACEKINSLDKEWKGVFVEDLKLYIQKLELKTKLAKVVLDQIACGKRSS